MRLLGQILCMCSTEADPTANPMTLGSAAKVGGQKSTKGAGKYWVGCTSRQDVVTTQTRRRVGDIYCTASHRSTTTSPKPLTGKPEQVTTSYTDRQDWRNTQNSTNRRVIGIASTDFDEFLRKKKRIKCRPINKSY